MKTIEEKAKAYDKVRKKIAIRFGSNVADEFFAEFEGSKNEEIRKALLEMVHDTTGDELWVDYNVHKENALAWLEKQEGCEYIKKDWLEHIKQSWYKEGFIDGKYSGGTSKEWTINDASILKELIGFLENGTAKLQHDLTKYANWLKIQFTPIEKQDEQKPQRMISAEAKEAMYDKPAWSEEDVRVIDDIFYSINEESVIEGLNDRGIMYALKDIRGIVRYLRNWLQSLKGRVQPQPKQEWSEEDEKIINGLIDSLTRISLNTRTDSTSPNFSFYKEIDWLKSLRPQNRWKPSDEQIAQLQIAVDTYGNEGIYDLILTELLFQLKKLKEGKV